MSEKKTEVIDGEAVEVIRTEAMAPPQSMMVDLATLGQTDKGVALFEERVRGAHRMMKAALKLTKPSQWTVFGEGENRTPYATAGAADRILRMGFGMKFGKKTVNVTDNENKMVAVCTADLLNSDGSVYETFHGSREAEYNDAGDLKGYVKTEQDMIKGAICNMKHTAVTDLLGLRFLSPEDFKDLGLDLDKLKRRAEFQTHSQNAADLTVPFGRYKGKRPSELDQSALDWHYEAAKKSVADPAKAKWKAKNQLWLDALELEKSRRGGSTETPPPAEAPPPPAEAEDDGLPVWGENPEVEAES
jgi:hypothetical protein